MTRRNTLVYARELALSRLKSAEFAHDCHQLVVATDGAFTVRNFSGAWKVPAGAAAWIPAGFRHSVTPAPRARVLSLYLQRTAPRGFARSCAVLALPPLARAIADHIASAEALRADAADDKRLFNVLIDQLRAARELALFVPALTSPLAQRVAAALAADPADTPTVQELAAAMDVSGRTIERAFAADAGMTLGEWRQRQRMGRAIELLAGGSAVKDVALEAGYEAPSAFVAAFKKRVGFTPGKLS